MRQAVRCINSQLWLAGGTMTNEKGSFHWSRGIKICRDKNMTK